jgi:hypothetical protein
LIEPISTVGPSVAAAIPDVRTPRRAPQGPDEECRTRTKIARVPVGQACVERNTTHSRKRVATNYFTMSFNVFNATIRTLL